MSRPQMDKLDCQQARQAWHDRIDGVADPEATAAMELHLGGCEDCRRYCAQMQAMADALDHLRVVSERGGPVAVQPQRRAGWGALQVGRIAAAIALVVGAGLYVAMRQRGAVDERAVVVAPPTPAATQRQATEEPAGRSEPGPRAWIRLTGEFTNAYLVERRDSGHPRVHVFKLYPLVQRESDEKDL